MSRTHPKSRGYNLVEVLVTLAIASIITITMVNFVNDIDMRHKVAIARADVTRIAEAAHLAEAQLSRITTVPAASLGILNLTSSSRLAWGLSSKLLEVPTEDPWGNRFIRVPVGGSGSNAIGYVRVTASVGAAALGTASPYVIDEGLGRVISAGPDGIVDTHLGQDPADSEADIVVEYRHKPWLFYNVGGRMFVNSADGGASPTNPAGIDMGAGTNAQVSPDGLRFAAVASGALILGSLTWALETEGASPVPRTDAVNVAPRSRTMSFSQNQWTLSQTALTVDAGTIPVWLPDSSGIVFQTGGDLYRYDAARGARTGVERGEVIKLNDQIKLSVTGGATSSGRVVYSNRRTAAYIDGGAGIYMTVSGDGKVAYRDEGGGITLALGDGTARRILKTGGDFAPLAWLDNNDVLYWDRKGKRLWRIAQDATIDLPLHETGKPSIDNVSNPVLSPDGKYLALLQSSSKGNVVKTDGTGFVTNQQNEMEFGGANLGVAPAMIWRQASDCDLRRLLYMPGGTDTPIKMLGITATDKFYQSSAVSFTDPEACGNFFQSPQAFLLEGMNPLYYDLSRDEKLFAVVSPSDSTKRPTGGRGGIFVVPLTGSSQAMTRIAPGVTVNSSGYNYVSWLLN